MDRSRSLLLSKFFEEHGILANQREIYEDMVIDDLRDNYNIAIPTDQQYCLDNAKNYDIRITTDKEEFEVPMITSDGYFIIHGIKKIPLIQESKSRYSMFFTLDNDITCETRFLGSRNSMKIVFSDNVYIKVLVDNRDKYIHVNDLFYMWDNMNDTGLEESCSVLAYKYMKGKYRESEVMSIIGSIGDDMNEDLYKYFEEYILGQSTIKESLYTIIYILSKCVSIKLGSTEPTDRDNCGFKIFHSSGHIISNLIRRAFRKKSGRIRKRMENELYSVMKTGNIKIGNTIKSKLVVQVGTRSTLDAMSSIRRIIVPADDNSMSHKMRQIHVTQRGFICPSETPEGKQVGLTKNLALTCIISPRMEDIYDIVLDLVTQDPGEWVIYNGVVVGFEQHNTYSELLRLKKTHPYMSVNRGVDSEIFIRTWEGRLMRPLIKTNNRVFPWNEIDGKSWNKLLRSRIIEYVDPLEVDLNKIAKTSYNGQPSDFTHMEIHPYTMFGISASTIPFINHNHGARSIFASSMIKQAMQCPPDLTTDGKYLAYAQRPLVYTQSIDILDLPLNGVNALVCIMSYAGYNQEDAIIVKKSFIERGGLSSVSNKMRRIELEYGKRDVIVQEREDKKAEIRITDTSESSDNIIWVIDGTDEKVVNKYYSQTISNDDTISTSRYRRLRQGDKLSSRHAQKGVVGLVMNEVDMPFTEDGITPDIIINPHGVPSRMTMGQMMEGLLGRRCAVHGKFIDGTPFGNVDISKEIDNEIVFTNGMTGEIMESYGAMDIVYYMALTHQVIDKIYIRSIGPRSEFSHQPLPGRSKEGGLRFGEMELDLLIAHGGSSMITNIIKNSDMEVFRMCRECNYFPVDANKCRMCDNTRIMDIEMPYGIKVLKDLMLINNIYLHINAQT